MISKDNVGNGNKHYIISSYKRIIALKPYKRTIRKKKVQEKKCIGSPAERVGYGTQKPYKTMVVSVAPSLQ